MKLLKNLLSINQEEIHQKIKKLAKRKKMKVEEKEGLWLLINYHPNSPCLVAHLDTVCQEKVKKKDLQIDFPIIRNRKKQPLGGDDRCGVWIIWRLIEKKVLDYSYLLCWNEEIGCLGSNNFPVGNYQFNCFIGLDRRGCNDLALYGYDNDALIKIFTDFGFVEVDGSITDVAILAERSGIACVNLSVGFMNEHTNEEFINHNWMKNTFTILENTKIRKKLKNEIFYSNWFNDLYNFENDFCEICGGEELKLINVSGIKICGSCYQKFFP